MKSMNTGDKTRSVTVRMTQEQYDFLAEMAASIGVSASHYLRMVVSSAVYAAKKADKRNQEVVEELKGAYDEYKQANQRHKLQQSDIPEGKA